MTLVLLATFAAGVAWQVGQGSPGGWAGVLFLPAFEIGETPELAGLPGLVVWVDPGSLAASSGLDTGDAIVAIDGVPLADLDRLRELRRRKAPGSTLTYEVATARGTERIEVPLVPAPRRSGPFGLAVTAVTGFVFLLTGAYVFQAAPRRAGANVFYLMCALGAGGFFVETLEVEVLDLAGFEPFATNPLWWTVLAFYLVQLVLVTNLLLHFSLIYPQERPVVGRRPRIFWWLHGLALWPFGPLAVGVLGAVAAGRLAVTDLGLLLWSVVGGLLLVYLVAVVLVYSGLTCSAFYRGYRSGDIDERRQVLWPVWGTLVAFVGVALLAVLGFGVALFSPRPELPAWAGAPARIFYVLIPVSFALGFLKRRLEAIDRLMERTVVYGGAAGLVVLSWLVAVVPLAFVLVKRPDLPGRVITAGATLVVAAFFFPLRRVVEGWVGSRRPPVSISKP